jgi:pimeloyl-ACP methyl ester carboxylesterase
MVHVRPLLQPEPLEPRRRRSWKRWAIVTYLLLLAASHITQAFQGQPAPLEGTKAIVMPSLTPGLADERIVYMEWDGSHATDIPGGGVSRASRPPVLLIHGSPGRASLFAKMAPLIAEAGHRVIAVDLPGFGDSSRDIADHSMLAHSQRVLKLMDRLGIDRAHLVGWSNGGGVVLHMADAAGQRTASLTMLGAVGDQAQEGSGSYALEHAKYALGMATIGGIPELVPHFGRWGTFDRRIGFLRNFWDSDQRPLRAIMQKLAIPTLIVHGRQDCMISVDAAHAHHDLLQSSSLVLLKANHFLPVMQPAESAAALIPFLARHDEPGSAEPRIVTSIDPEAPPRGVLGALYRARAWLRDKPWPAQLGIASLTVLICPPVGVVACAWMATTHGMDYLLALLAVILGMILKAGLLAAVARVVGTAISRVPLIGPRAAELTATHWVSRLRTRPAREGWISAFVPALRKAGASAVGLHSSGPGAAARFLAGHAAGLIVWSMLAYGLVIWSMIWFYRLLRTENITAWRLAGLALVLGLIAQVAPMLLVRRGRQRLLSWWERTLHYEYWPMWVFYLPVVPYVGWLMLKHHSIRAPMCCNPGIENGGGLVGESKVSIMRRLGDHPAVLPTVPVEPADSIGCRVQAAINAMRRAELDFPIVIKPDAGQRGFGVRLIHSPEELAPYFKAMTVRAVIQPYDPGPHEVGVMWVRHLGASPDGCRGFIYSITRKDFPHVTGDGARTVEDLIHAHPRLRRQSHVFLERLGERAHEVLPAGNELRLCVAGNHCQGTQFRDGADLITPELTRAIDDLAASFEGGLDFGRFDLRYESDDLLRRGEAFSVVELNGTASESTNIYDPARNILWAYRVLFGQWKLLFALGDQRRRAGGRPMGLLQLLAAITHHYRCRTGSAISD